MTITELKAFDLYQDEEKGIIEEEFDEEKAGEGTGEETEELAGLDEEGKIETGDDDNIEE